MPVREPAQDQRLARAKRSGLFQIAEATQPRMLRP